MTNLFSYTPLFRAVCSKNEAVVSALLSDSHININLRSRKELHTPLLEAIISRYYPIINLLLAVPAVDLSVCNFRNETPVVVAARLVLFFTQSYVTIAIFIPPLPSHQEKKWGCAYGKICTPDPNFLLSESPLWLMKSCNFFVDS